MLNKGVRKEAETEICSSAGNHLPSDHKSDGMLQPTPRMTSGARYCLVLTTDDFFSLSYVAAPKSITLICVLSGMQYLL